MEINEFLHSKIAPDECWHEFSDNDVGHATCRHCGDIMRSNPHYVGNAEGFFKVWDWAKEQDWWGNFCYTRRLHNDYEFSYWIHLINKDTFPVLVAEYLGWGSKR